ncbi:unnamed protein product, partial [Ceratitis capitata]
TMDIKAFSLPLCGMSSSGGMRSITVPDHEDKTDPMEGVDCRANIFSRITF